MISIYICIAAIAVMLGISLKARKDFAPDERIPMQWDLSGKANWSARRDIAIWIMPAIALLTLIFTLVIVVISQVSDHIIGYSVVGLTAVMFVIIHKGHLVYARHWIDKRNKD